jgi:hypothetical protein
MRNNEERLGIKNPIVDNAIENSSNQLNMPTLTDFVDLPTKGKYYPEGHPLKGKEQVEIKFMTSHEEDLLTSKSLLKKGIAIDRVLSSLLVGKVDIDSLFIGDKNALIIATRINGYGSDYTTKITCPRCEETIDYEFNLEDIKITNGNQELLGSDGLITIELPKTKAKVCCRLLNGKDEKFLSQMMENKKKHKLEETNITDQLKLYVVSVNGSLDQQEVFNFITKMPSLDSKYLRKVYQESIPNVDLTQEVNCSHCGEESEVIMPLGTTFFWPK